MIAFEPVTADTLPILAAMADEIWHEFFPCILSPEQIDYMVEKFQSLPAMEKQLADGYEYFFITDGATRVGYTGIHPEDSKLFLSKLYLQKDARKKGYAQKTLDFLAEYCREQKLRSIWLTVNRYNDAAISAYQKRGFRIIREQKADIGNGFFMDDYIMELTI